MASLKWPHEGTGEHGAAQARREEAENALGAQRVHHVAHAVGGVVHVLQDPVAQHDVVATALDDVEEAVGVALDTLDTVGDPGLGGPALQREQRVRAGVDDGDTVAESGHGHREVAAAASGVEDVQRLPPGGLDPAVESVLEDLPDHGGTERSARARRVRHGS